MITNNTSIIQVDVKQLAALKYPPMTTAKMGMPGQTPEEIGGQSYNF